MKNLSAVQIKTIAFLIVAVLLLGITVISENLRAESVQPDVVETDGNISSNYSANTGLSQETVENDANEEAIYTVKEYEGAIAVFKQGEMVPVMRQKVAVNSLPEEDQALLEKGVDFATYRDMLFFLENFE